MRFYCGFAPGGTADLLCRILADAVTPEVGQKVIVDTKTGASGFIANETVANAAPDGRTIGLAAMAAMCVAPVMPGQKLPINVDTDLTPIANIAGVYNMLVFGKHVAFRTVPELIEHARKNPGKLSYASAGNGTSQHLAGELFQKMAGVKLLHVPYRGGAPAIQDMVAGNCDMMFGNMPEFLGQIGGGGLIPIAFGSPHVSPLFPNLPLISQYLPGFEVVNWFAVFGSKGLPADLVAVWNKALRAAVAKPDVQKRFVENGMDTVIGSPEELKATIFADRKKWADVIKEAGIRGGLGASGCASLRAARRIFLRVDVIRSSLRAMEWRAPSQTEPKTCRSRRHTTARCITKSSTRSRRGSRRREAILFHHGIGGSAGIWAGWQPALADGLPDGHLRHARVRTVGYSGGGLCLVARSPGRGSVRGGRRGRVETISSRGRVRSAARWRWPPHWRGPSGSPRSPSATAPISAPRSSGSRPGGASSTQAG